MKRFFFLAVFFLAVAAAAPAAQAQIYDTTCPAGSSVAPNGAARNQTDDHIKQNFCLDATGAPIINGPVTIIGPCTGTGCVGTGGVALTTGQCPSATAGNTLTGSTTCLDLNGVAGADLGAKINACVAALPAAGGKCMGDNLAGAQTLSTAVNINKSVALTFSGQQISQSANVTLSGAEATIPCTGAPAIWTKAGNLDQFTVSGTNASVNCQSLVGVQGSFTGNGITISSSSGSAAGNIISGEAGAGISDSGGGYVGPNNSVASTSAGHAITSGSNGRIIGNTMSSTISDAFFTAGVNNVTSALNTIQLTPNASTSGLCGENFTGDQLGNSSLFNNIFINDSTNSGNVDKGICLTAPASGHMLDMVVDGGMITGIVSGTVTTYSVSINNTLGLGNNWSILVKDVRAVHIGPPVSLGAQIQDIDALSNPVSWEDLALGDGTALTDGTTTGTNNIFINHVVNTLTAATIPAASVTGNGSQFYCTNCNRQGVAGGNGAMLFKVNSQLAGLPQLNWTYVNGTNLAASATTVAKALAFHQNPGDTILVAGECTAVGAPTITVSDTSNGTYTQDFAPTTDGANHWIFLHRFSNVSGAASGANTVTIASAGNTCTYVNIAAAADYTGAILAPDGAGRSATGTSTAVASGALAVNQNDLVVGVLESFPTELNPGTSCTQQCRPGTGDFNTVFEDVIGPVSGTQNMQATGSASAAWAAIAFAYKLN